MTQPLYVPDPVRVQKTRLAEFAALIEELGECASEGRPERGPERACERPEGCARPGAATHRPAVAGRDRPVLGLAAASGTHGGSL